MQDSTGAGQSSAPRLYDRLSCKKNMPGELPLHRMTQGLRPHKTRSRCATQRACLAVVPVLATIAIFLSITCYNAPFVGLSPKLPGCWASCQSGRRLPAS